MGKYLFIYFLLLTVPGLGGKVWAMDATPTTWFQMGAWDQIDNVPNPDLPAEDSLREVLKASLDSNDDNKKVVLRNKMCTVLFERERKITLTVSGKLSDSLTHIHTLRAPPLVYSIYAI